MKTLTSLLRDDDAQHARALRSYWDVSRTLKVAHSAPRGAPSRHALLLRFEPSLPGTTPPAVTVRVPIVGNGLDLPHAELPKGLRLVPRVTPDSKH